MSEKLEKLGTELERARKKQTLWEEKVKHLEEKYRETENTEICTLVRSAELTPDELAELLKRHGENILPDAEILRAVCGKEEVYEGE